MHLEESSHHQLHVALSALGRLKGEVVSYSKTQGKQLQQSEFQPTSDTSLQNARQGDAQQQPPTLSVSLSVLAVLHETDRLRGLLPVTRDRSIVRRNAMPADTQLKVPHIQRQ